MKIHCILLTKNEADVIELCLNEATEWADFIYVYDGLSTDETWDIVKALQSTKIIPWKQDGKVFREGLRAEVFDAFRHNSSPGDWWLQLNADEFYPSSPRDFFEGVQTHHNFVWGINVEYVLTHQDLSELDFESSFPSLRPNLKYYRVGWSEPRAFRYRKGLKWRLDAAWPNHAGLVAPQRILFKHYPYRSPKQIQTRLDVRRANRERGFEGWDHASELHWQEKIVDHKRCLMDDGTNNFAIDETHLVAHMERTPVRIAKRLLHATRVWP
jgi:hypothetical protein